ncbi:hypothetical protein [Terasakiella pusilla]|jgi:hypothetical protein|uniref:hypothetical protein n=1 Tax=Terasakiella pusilla TaxID=64973 RepID=UPI003AA7CFB4
MKMPAFLLVFFGATLFFAKAPLYAKTGWPACPEDGRSVDIYVEQSMGQLRYHSAFNSAQLSNLRGNVGRRLGPMWVPTGLTIADENYRLSVSTKTYPLGQNRYCSILTGAKLFIGYQNIDVYVSNKYQPGSCEHESILNHENIHVRIFRETLYDHANGIETALRRKAPGVGPVYMRSPNGAASKVQRLLDAQIRPLFKRMSQEISRKNARIDTKSNYRREQALCSNW